jgi:hypothetical protein
MERGPGAEGQPRLDFRASDRSGPTGMENFVPTGVDRCSMPPSFQQIGFSRLLRRFAGLVERSLACTVISACQLSSCLSRVTSPAR